MARLSLIGLYTLSADVLILGKRHGCRNKLSFPYRRVSTDDGLIGGPVLDRQMLVDIPWWSWVHDTTAVLDDSTPRLDCRPRPATPVDPPRRGVYLRPSTSSIPACAE
jgi:hypothetical protein